MLFIFLEQVIISWSAIEFTKTTLFVIFSGRFVIIKSIKLDDASVVRVGSVITCFNPKMLSSDLKSLLVIWLIGTNVEIAKDSYIFNWLDYIGYCKNLITCSGDHDIKIPMPMLWKTETTIFIRMIARAFVQRKQPKTNTLAIIVVQNNITHLYL